MDTVVLIQNTADYAPDYIEASTIEVEVAIRLTDICIENGVPNIVYCSFAGSNYADFPHFYCKGIIEKYLLNHKSDFTSLQIIRSTYFIDNLIWDSVLEKSIRVQKTLALPLNPNVQLPLVSVEGFGKSVADCVFHPQLLVDHGN
ncbi:hypothetical protein P9112_003068 [Eukaryota sp. TZLM1-RC]